VILHSCERKNVFTPKKIIQVLHQIVFEQLGDRDNRKRLREFNGFKFGDSSPEHSAKIVYITANFGVADLVSVANILGIDYYGDIETLTERICSCLMDIDKLVKKKKTTKAKKMKTAEKKNCEDEEREDDEEEDDDEEDEDDEEESISEDDEDDDAFYDDTEEDNDEETNKKTPKTKALKKNVNDVKWRKKKREDKTQRKKRNKWGDSEEETEDEQKIRRRVKNANRKQKKTAERRQNYEESESECEESPVRRERRRHVRGEFTPRFSMSSRDIDDALQKFSGDDGYTIAKFIEDFEETAEIMEWTSIEKFVYGKKSLSGTARLFLRSEHGVRSWKILKKRLLEEFGKHTNSAEIHKKLSSRKKKSDETFQQYLFSMKEIASQGDVEESALIDYVVQGIPDEETNKSILYGAKSIKHLKEKLLVYTKFKNSQEKRRAEVKPKDEKSKQPAPMTTKDRCYNCGRKGHKSKECKDKSKGTKCFSCNEFGHLSNACPSKQEEKKEGSTDNKNHKKALRIQEQEAELDHGMNKHLEVNGVKMMALVDTGSDFNLITLTSFLDLGAPNFERKEITFTGFGKGLVKALGQFEAVLKIDQASFKTILHVVPDGEMPIDMTLIVGKPILMHVTLMANAEKIEVVPRPKFKDEKDSCDELLTEENAVMLLRPEEEEELDIGGSKHKEEIKKMVENYTPKATKKTNVTMKIIVQDEKPIFQSPRRLSISEKREVDELIQQWLEDGIIKPSSSDFASPIVLVKKKNGETRICVDFRKLNSKIIKDRYPLPVIEDQLDKLCSSRVFTTIDLKNGFFHVPIEESCTKYTSFVTPSGQYEFLKAPFGLCNSPAVFQRFINNIFRDLIQKDLVLAYMDDLVIPAENEEEAIDMLKTVMRRAEEYGLLINWKKCQFLKRKIEYLGHEVENGVIRPSPGKIAAVTKFPKPTTLKQVQSFLGLTGYFRKFVKNYSIIAKPLSDLLKGERKFKFGEEEKMSFEMLKQKLCEEPVLKIFDFEKETELHTDASRDGYGAMLVQRDDVDGKFHPVYYMSRKTTDAEKKYSSYELEVLAIIEALKKFRTYLLGIKFKIKTDCSAFTMTMKKKDLVTRVARWALLLEEFDYVLEHRPGNSMKHCDALSRNPIVMSIKNAFLEKLSLAQQNDAHLKVITEVLKIKPYKNFVFEKSLLYKDEDGTKLLVIPEKMEEEIIKSAHENGHFSVRKTKELVQREYWISGLEEKIKKIVSNCVPCILAERKSGKQEGFLNPIDKGDRPLQTYHVDHLGPLSQTKKGYKYIFAVIDAFTKFVWLYPTKTTNSEEVIRHLKDQQSIFGNPKTIISDRGAAFTSAKFEEYCAEEKIKLVHITTGVPRGNGQIERVNRTIVPLLTKLSMDDSEKWYKHLRKVQEALNSTYHRSIARSPSELFFGVTIRRTEDLKLKEMIEEEFVNQFIEDRQSLREEAKRKIEEIQIENCRTYNKKRKSSLKYQVGDLVAIKRTQFAPCSKLLPKFLGPYRVTNRTGIDRYEVEKIGNLFRGKLASWNLEFCNSCVVLLRNVQVPRRNSDSHLVFRDPTQLRAKKRI
jgi:hypothetical protein